MQIGVFGGGFDPPHIGHLVACEIVRERLKLDRIIFVPTFNPPHKRIDTPFHHRVKMTELAIKDNPCFFVSDIEKSLEVPSFTIRTLKELQKRYPEDEFYLIIGADEFKDFKNWKSPEEILRIAKIVILYRPDYIIMEDLPRIAILLEIPQIGISSTQLREWIREKMTVRYLIPDRVLDYIRDNRLYEDMHSI